VSALRAAHARGMQRVKCLVVENRAAGSACNWTVNGSMGWAVFSGAGVSGICAKECRSEVDAASRSLHLGARPGVSGELNGIKSTRDGNFKRCR
jgi:hypothetical protein